MSKISSAFKEYRVLAIFDESDSNDKIAKTIIDVLAKLKNYRDNNF